MKTGNQGTSGRLIELGKPNNNESRKVLNKTEYFIKL